MKSAPRLLVVLLVAALTGCTTPSGASSAKTSSSSASTSSTASPADGLPSGVLFRITALVTAPTGETARLVETVMAPTAGTGGEVAQMTASQCDLSGWQSEYPRPHWLSVAVSTTLLSGSSWPDEANAILAEAGGVNARPAMSGDIRTYQAYCDSGLVGVPAAGAYLLPIDPTVPADDSHSWGSWQYGFGWAADGADAEDAPFAVTSCNLEKGAGAAASATVSAWDPAQPDLDTGGYPSCYWGAL